MTRYTDRLRPQTPGKRPSQPTRPSQRPVDRGRGSGLPSVNTGALRSRWTRYTGTDEGVPVNVNCWRVTVYFFDVANQKPIWDGLFIDGIWAGATVDSILTVVLGGAMFDERPVYMNEVHYLRGSAAQILVVEEFFDPAVKSNN